MKLSWLESLIYGVISGLTEFLPVSSVAHQAIVLKLFGAEQLPFLQFCASLGCLVALLLVSVPTLLRLRREQKIASIPRSRRRRPPDVNALMENRVLRMAALTTLVVFIGYSLVYNLYERLWILAGFMAVNGIILFLPPYMTGANKGARSLSSLDALLIGLAAGVGMIPGISRIGSAISIARIRGTDRRYAADLALLISIPALVVLTVIQLFGAVAATAWSGMLVLCGITVLVAAFGAGYLGIYFLRFLAYKAGYSGFAYYCWGAALFTLLLYLI